MADATWLRMGSLPCGPPATRPDEPTFARFGKAHMQPLRLPDRFFAKHRKPMQPAMAAPEWDGSSNDCSSDFGTLSTQPTHGLNESCACRLHR